jgi:hypothetical protein
VSTSAGLISAFANPAVGHIVLATGTYSTDLTIDRSLVLEAAVAGSVVLRRLNIGVSGGIVQVIGLNITGGSGSGGVGGGMVIGNGRISFVSCHIYSNFASGAGGAVYINSDNTVTFELCSIHGNTGGRGGGVYIDGGVVIFRSCNIYGNSGGSQGGGINVYGGIVTLSSCSISGNSAGYGGGVNVDGGQVTLSSCSITGNSAGYGGGVSVQAIGGCGNSGCGSATIESSSIFENTATYGTNIFVKNGGRVCSWATNLTGVYGTVSTCSAPPPPLPLSSSASDPTGVIVGVIVGVIIALALLLVNRRRSQQQRAAKATAKEAAKKAWNPHKPTFYFLPRAAVLSAMAKQLGRMQELRDSLQLVKLAIDLNEAFQGKGLIPFILFISHRWEDSVTPDETGAQLAAIQAHLKAHPDIQFIWFDYSCMPQRSGSAHRSGKDDRTMAEKAEFDLMLSAISDLYLTANVLILLDTMYRTRFWTTMVGWCAMQKVTSQGVRPAREGEARTTVSCIHNATQEDRQALLNMSIKTPSEISNFLASPDVAVTNQKDKTTMLPIVGKTDEHVREMMSGMHIISRDLKCIDAI